MRQSQKQTVSLEEARHEKELLVKYVRDKVDQLLDIMGTSPINPHELDDQTLIELDPVGIICDSFSHVLDTLRQTNSELSLARDEIKTIFDTAGAAIMVLSPKREILAYNHKVEEFFLHGHTDVIGKDCSEVICAGSGDKTNCSFKRVVEQSQSDRSLEWSFQGRSFDVVGKPIYDASGEVSHVILSYNDISERKRSMLALRDALLEAREAQNRIKGILRSVEDGLIVTDAAGQIVLMNQMAEKLLRGVSDLGEAHDGFALQLNAHLHGNQANSGLWVSDLKYRSGDEPERIYQARSSLVAQQGEGGGAVTFLHEVTREREIERLKSEFVSTAAHELRTPLSTILGFSELILNEVELPVADVREYIGIIHQKAEGLAQIVNDLLDISRIESGEGLQIDLAGCRLKDLCDDALLGFKVQADKYTFDLTLPAEEIWVRADRFAVAQVLENILSNAVKYSPQGSVITFSAEVAGEEVRFCIADQGIGMTPEQIEKIFDKFYRADASNTAISGTGLGMTIVKHIVDAHGGRVWLESTPARGTKVHFTLQRVAS